MKRIVIVGAGVSGLTLALNVKENNNEIIILEKNKEAGKKILISGNGRCNFLNDDFSINHYHSLEDNNLNKLINEKNKDLILDFIKKLGIEYKIKNGYYYPFTNKSSTIRDSLISEIKQKNIKIVYDYKVETIEKKEKYYIINNVITCDYLAICTGSKSYEITGSTGDGYNLLSTLNHSVTNLYPSLVQITTKGKFLKKLHGVRTDAIVSIWNDKEKIKEEFGELQLTDYGVSGICVFNLSRYVHLYKNTLIKINFVPFIKGDVIDYLDSKNINLSIYDLLVRIMNEKIVKVILELLNIEMNTLYKNLSEIERNELKEYLTNFKLEVTGTKSFENSQVTLGGIKLSEVNLDSFESKINDRLYILGELLDVDGDCGGYNISFAILSALLAAKSIRGKND